VSARPEGHACAQCAAEAASLERQGLDPWQAAELVNAHHATRHDLERHARSREVRRGAAPAGDLPLFNTTERAQRDLF
jgi:hypothetical protein